MSTSTKTVLPDVRPGQVWADNDPRGPRRYLRVESVTDQGGGPRAILVPVANRLDAWVPIEGRRATSAAVGRFRPTSTGYRLVQDVEVTR